MKLRLKIIIGSIILSGGILVLGGLHRALTADNIARQQTARLVNNYNIQHHGWQHEFIRSEEDRANSVRRGGGILATKGLLATGLGLFMYGAYKKRREFEK